MGSSKTLCKDKLHVLGGYIPHRESKYHKLYGIDCDDPFSDVCADILTVLVVGDCNARVETCQNVEVSYNVMWKIVLCQIRIGFSYTCLNA